MQNTTPQPPQSLRVRLTLPLIALTMLLVYVPGGCRDSWMANHRARLARKLASIAASPVHAKCALCSRPATHSQMYRGLAYERTYYFCDEHWPAPEKAPRDSLDLGTAVDDISPQLRFDEIASLIPVGMGVLALAISLICRQVRYRVKAFNLAAVTFAVVLVSWTMARFFGAGFGK